MWVSWVLRFTCQSLPELTKQETGLALEPVGTFWRRDNPLLLLKYDAGCLDVLPATWLMWPWHRSGIIMKWIFKKQGMAVWNRFSYVMIWTNTILTNLPTISFHTTWFRYVIVKICKLTNKARREFSRENFTHAFSPNSCEKITYRPKHIKLFILVINELDAQNFVLQ